MNRIATAIIIFVTASAAHAESLSQLDFDGRFAAPAGPEPKPEAVLVEPAAVQEAAPAAQPQEQSSAAPSVQDIEKIVQGSATAAPEQTATKKLAETAAKRSAPRASLKPVSWPNGVVGFITPSLHGVRHDRSGKHRLTSENSWKSKKGKSCGQPANEAEALAKSNAIREVLFRYSGSEEFADEQCKATCDKPGYKHKLVGVSLKDLPGKGRFDFRNIAGECRYRLSRHPSEKWQVLQPSHVSCACLPGDA